MLVVSVTASSTLHVVAIGLACVPDMVMPLFFASLLWDRSGLAERDIFRACGVSVPLGDLSLCVPLTDPGAFAIFGCLGGLMVGPALTGAARIRRSSWFSFSYWGSDRFAVLAQHLSFVPEWAISLGLLAVIAGLAVLTRPQQGAAET